MITRDLFWPNVSLFSSFVTFTSRVCSPYPFWLVSIHFGWFLSLASFRDHQMDSITPGPPRLTILPEPVPASSQARGWIRATAAGLCHSHSHARSISRFCNLHHCSQQHQIPNPLSKARDWTHILVDTSQSDLFLLCHNGSSLISY